MVENDSSHYLKMFGEVCKSLSAEMSEIWLSRPKFRSWVSSRWSRDARKISIFQFLLIMNYPVSYKVNKAYKVILGLIFESAWTITPFDTMRKTDMLHVKCLCGLTWKLACKHCLGFRKASTIFHVRFIWNICFIEMYGSRILTPLHMY